MNWVLGTKATLSLSAILTCAIIFVVFAVKIIRIIHTSNDISATKDKKQIRRLFISALIAVMLGKLIVAYLGPNYTMDVYCFASWSRFLVNTGIPEFYETHWCNYPAGYMYVLYIIGKLNTILDLNFYGTAYGFVLKMPSLISEGLLCLMAYYTAGRFFKSGVSAMIALAVLLNPANLVNASAWGQVDMVFILLVVVTFYLLEEKKYLLAAVAFALTMLMKTQGIFFLPVFGLAYIRMFKRPEKPTKALLALVMSIFVFVGTYTALSLPFMNGQGLEWIINNISSSAGTYDFVSLMAHNIYTLFGVAHLTHGEMLLFFSYQVWGYIFITITSGITVWLIWKNSEKKMLYLAAAFLIAGIFTFAHGMHERYILPVPTLLLFAYIDMKDVRILLSAVLYALFAMINQGSVLFFGQEAVYPAIAAVNSAFGLICFIFLVCTVFALLVKNDKEKIRMEDKAAAN